MSEVKQVATRWYESHIVTGWYKTWTVWAAGLALALPDILQWLLTNWALLDSFGGMTDDTKNQLRVWIIAAIPVLRAIRQKGLEREQAEKAKEQ